MTKKLAFFFLAITILFSACRKDTDMTTETPVGGTDNPNPTSEIVDGNLIGNISDEYNNPVEGAVVRIKSNTTFTDENGNFSFTNIPMEDDGVLLTASKVGFFEAFDRVRAKANQTSYTRVQLLDRAIIGSFPAGAAQDVTFDGATVKFQSNGFVDENGADYNGTVNVAAHWIDPTSDALDQQMPGDLRAIDSENELAALQSYGMVAVDLIADNGADVQLKEGFTSEISFPIPSEISNNAPATIPLWSFDEEQGLWVEEGTASKVGNMYVGNVAHFSFWNCDAAFPLIEMDGQIVDENGDPIDQAVVCIDFADENLYSASGYSNEDGFFGGKIPKNELLNLSVKDNCNNPIFTTQIGPFTEDVDLGQISVTTFDDYNVNITGSLVNCDGQPVTNGYAKVKTGSSWYSSFPVEPDENGNWSTSLIICQDDVDILISGYDLDGPLTSEITSYPVNAGGGDIDAGVIEVCEELEEYLNLEYNMETISFIDPEIGNDGEYHYINGNATTTAPNDSLSFFSLAYIGDGAGTFMEIQNLSYSTYDPAVGTEEGFFCQVCSGTVEVTTYEDFGGFVQGTFEGEVMDYTGNNVAVSGSFRIRRD